MGNKKYNPFKVLLKLLTYGKRYIPTYILLCLMTMLTSVLSVGIIEAYRNMVNGAVDDNFELVTNAAIAAFLLTIIIFFLTYSSSYLSATLENKSTLNMQSKVLDRVLKSKIKHLHHYKTTDIISRITDSVEAAQSGLNNIVIILLGDILLVVFMLVYLGYLNLYLTLGSIIVAIILPLLLAPWSRFARKNYDKQYKVVAERNAIILDSIQGGEVVRTHSLSSKMMQRFREKYQELTKLVKKGLFYEALISVFNFLVPFIGVIYVLGYGGFLVIRGEIDVGSVVGFLVAIDRLIVPLSRITNTWFEFQKSIAHANRVFEMFNIPTEDKLENDSNTELIFLEETLIQSPNIAFKDVEFSYNDEPNSTNVLRGVSFEAQSGKITAIVGVSGSGKSTILNLLMRFYEPFSGGIYINGIPMKNYSLKNWRDNIGYVSQRAQLFSGTIYENIVMGKSEVSEKTVIDAAKKANIHDFIMNQPAGYQTEIGENGLTFSGGERQRLSIARAFIRNPRIILLDEPTSALDTNNEFFIRESLNELTPGKTTIIVAHRLSTIKHADKIIYLDNGISLEEGIHQELMDAKGKYSQMYST